MRSIFFTGVTGYIGGTVLPTMLRVLRENNEEYQVRVLIRSESKCQQVAAWAKQRGLEITPVIGDMADKEVIMQECMRADTIISCADAFGMQFAKYLIEALAHSIEQGHYPAVIHTSGNNSDDACGMRSTDKIESDADPLQIDHPEPNQEVDLVLLNFYEQNRGKLDLAVISPPTIWGIGRGPSAVHSAQVPILVKVAFTQNQVFNVGKGLNRWTQINVVDLARMYALLVLNMIKSPGKHGGFYFCENGEFEWREVSQQIQQGLYDAGFILNGKVQDTDPEDKVAFERVFDNSVFDFNVVVGGNARVRADRARKDLGWEPVYSSRQQFFDFITEEVAILAKQQQ